MFNVTGLPQGLSLGKIIGGLSRTLQIANQIIPLYQRAKPTIINARNMLNMLKEINKKEPTSKTAITEKEDSNTEKNVAGPLEKAPTTPTFFL